MNHQRLIFLLVVQSMVIVVLLVTFLGCFGWTSTGALPSSGPGGILLWVLFSMLVLITILLFTTIFNSRKKLRHITNQLKRATKGNLKTRLLANEDSVWNEAIFAVNELIEQLEKVQVEAIQSQAARKSLLSSISHDIRTPLTSILGYIEAIKDGIASTDQEKQHYLDILSVKSASLKELIDEIFTMAKLDADELPNNEEELDLAEMMRETLIEFLPELIRSHIDPQIHLPESKCPILADRLGLTRILSNIIKNAITHGKEGKVLGVELTETAREYKLSIWDRGPGIPAAELPKVFDRSYRGDQARSSNSGSSGLGLAITKALVERNGGQIGAESQPWQKTAFTITFSKPIYSQIITRHS